MALAIDEVRSVLKDLAEICRDGEEGFREAASKISRPDLKLLFSDFSAQRARFADELHTLIAKLGGEPDNSGTVAGAIHRGWINLKAMVAGRDDAAIINEAERGEDVAKEHYRDALKKDLPADIRAVVERQSEQVLATHNQVRALELNTQTASRSAL